MGKYIKKFDTHSDYEDFIETEDFIRPNVSYCVDNKDVHYNSTQTLFAYEEEPGKFIFGEFQGDTLRIQTRGNSTTVWLCSNIGVIVGTMTMSAPTLEKILQAVNEKYGTSFEGWSQLPTVYEVGDTLPNWNAYEKILLPEMVNFRYLRTGSSANITGFMQGDKAYLNAANETSIWNVSPEGQVWGAGGQASLYEEQTKTLLLSNFGRQISEVLPFVVEWQQGSQVPNWESYTLLT